MQTIGAVVLAGGGSKRFGANKALLRRGSVNFMQHVIHQLSDFDELLISAAHKADYQEYGLPVVADHCPHCGPLGGLHAALTACRSDYLLAVSCDMPLFKAELAAFLTTYADSGHDAYCLVNSHGMAEPLCCIYGKSALPVIEQHLRQSNYRLLDLLQAIHTKYVSIRHSAYSDNLLTNINTPQEYQHFLRHIQTPPVIAISGLKNAGKTTLICHLLPLLRQSGLKIGVVKHDGHDFYPDVPGTDSDRLRQAGADAVAVYSNERYLSVTHKQNDLSIEALLPHFQGLDLILVEGGKYSSYPKIEVVRQANHTGSVCDPATLLALYADTNIQLPDVPKIPFGDYPKIARIIIEYLEQDKSTIPPYTNCD